MKFNDLKKMEKQMHLRTVIHRRLRNNWACKSAGPRILKKKKKKRETDQSTYWRNFDTRSRRDEKLMGCNILPTGQRYFLWWKLRHLNSSSVTSKGFFASFSKILVDKVERVGELRREFDPYQLAPKLSTRGVLRHVLFPMQSTSICRWLLAADPSTS